MTEQRHLSDEQIAAHEAGHALVAHLFGEQIAQVDAYNGPQAAKVSFVSAIQAEQIRLAGTCGELAAGFSASPPDACGDMNGVDLEVPRAEPGALSLLWENGDAHTQLSAAFTSARRERRVITGSEVHNFLEDLGCVFGSQSNSNR